MKRKAEGVVLHKVDRGARNLADWAKFAELADAGIDVHFATEALDFRSRGGRLTADIQAVIASDFIRNLRKRHSKASGVACSRASTRLAHRLDTRTMVVANPRPSTL